MLNNEGKNGTLRMSNDFLRYAAGENVRYSSPSVGRHRNKISIDAVSEIGNALFLCQVIVNVERIVLQLQLLRKILHVFHHHSIALEVARCVDSHQVDGRVVQLLCTTNNAREDFFLFTHRSSIHDVLEVDTRGLLLYCEYRAVRATHNLLGIGSKEDFVNPRLTAGTHHNEIDFRVTDNGIDSVKRRTYTKLRADFDSFELFVRAELFQLFL